LTREAILSTLPLSQVIEKKCSLTGLLQEQIWHVKEGEEGKVSRLMIYCRFLFGKDRGDLYGENYCLE